MILPDGVREMLARHEKVFPTRDVASLAADYRNPVAVFLPDGLRVEKTPEDTAATLRRLRQVALDHGTVSVRFQVLGIGEVRPDRPSVLVSWTFLGADGAVRGRSRVRYFMARQPDGGLLIEMLEYEATAFAEDRSGWAVAT